MSWVNANSNLLLQTDEAVSFSHRNDLMTKGNELGAHFYNQQILISIYEERGYLHADYYDLVNMRWKRELENACIGAEIIPLNEAKKIYDEASKESIVGPLKGESMIRFHFYLKMIDKYLQEFLAGRFVKYEKILEPLSEAHRIEIEKFVKENLGGQTFHEM